LVGGWLLVWVVRVGKVSLPMTSTQAVTVLAVSLGDISDMRALTFFF